MQVQNVEPTAGTLQHFQDFCEHLESALDKPVTGDKSNKTSKEKSNKKRHRNHNNNDKWKKTLCMLNGDNPIHSTEKCRTLKKEAEKHKKTCENGDSKNTKRKYTPTKEENHVLTAFLKEAMAKENVNKEFANFENMSMSSVKKTDEK